MFVFENDVISESYRVISNGLTAIHSLGQFLGKTDFVRTAEYQDILFLYCSIRVIRTQYVQIILKCYVM